MASLLEDVAAPTAREEPEGGGAAAAELFEGGGAAQDGPPPAPELFEGGGPPEGGEPPAPPAPPRVRFYERPGFRQAVWVLAFVLALLLIGVVFTPNFWRF